MTMMIINYIHNNEMRPEKLNNGEKRLWLRCHTSEDWKNSPTVGWLLRAALPIAETKKDEFVTQKWIKYAKKELLYLMILINILYGIASECSALGASY